MYGSISIRSVRIHFKTDGELRLELCVSYCRKWFHFVAFWCKKRPKNDFFIMGKKRFVFSDVPFLCINRCISYQLHSKKGLIFSKMIQKLLDWLTQSTSFICFFGWLSDVSGFCFFQESPTFKVLSFSNSFHASTLVPYPWPIIILRKPDHTLWFDFWNSSWWKWLDEGHRCTGAFLSGASESSLSPKASSDQHRCTLKTFQMETLIMLSKQNLQDST